MLVICSAFLAAFETFRRRLSVFHVFQKHLFFSEPCLAALTNLFCFLDDPRKEEKNGGEGIFSNASPIYAVPYFDWYDCFFKLFRQVFYIYFNITFYI